MHLNILPLKVPANDNDNHIFMDFCQTVYRTKNLIDDYTHIISTHEPHLQQINQQLT